MKGVVGNKAGIVTEHCLYQFRSVFLGFPHSSVGTLSACNSGDPGLIPGSGSSPGEGNGNPHQYSRLGNPMDRGAWQAIVLGVVRVEHDLATKLLYTFWIFSHLFLQLTDLHCSFIMNQVTFKFVVGKLRVELNFLWDQMLKFCECIIMWKWSCSVMSDSLWPHGL